jgi:hypothetical protein
MTMISSTLFGIQASWHAPQALHQRSQDPSQDPSRSSAGHPRAQEALHCEARISAKNHTTRCIYVSG